MSRTRHGWLLAAYPRSYRAQHGGEILATLAEATGPGRRVPPLREIGALMRGGLVARVRGRAQGPVPWWADGIHLGVFVLAVVSCAPGAANVLDAMIGLTHHFGFNYSPWWYPWDDLLPMAAAVALMRGWAWPALLPAVAMLSEQIWFIAASPMIGNLRQIMSLPWVAYNVVTQILPALLIVAGLLILATRGRRPLRTRSSWWWLLVLLEVVGYEGQGYRWLPPNSLLSPGSPHFWWTQAVITVVLVLLAFWATAVSADLRWAVAVGVFAIAHQFSQRPLWIEIPQQAFGHVLLTSCAIVGGLLLAMSLIARRARGRMG